MCARWNDPHGSQKYTNFPSTSLSPWGICMLDGVLSLDCDLLLAKLNLNELSKTKKVTEYLKKIMTNRFEQI